MIKPQDLAYAALLGLAAGAFIAMCALGGCTPAHQQPDYLGTGLKVATCVDDAVRAEIARRAEAERELRELGEREAETAAKLEKLKPIDQLPEYRVDAGVSREIDRIVRDGGAHE